MKEIHSKYSVNIGLEVHVQLLTSSKLFCSDSADFHTRANENISPITLGFPGVLPKINQKAVELAVKFGLACHSSITPKNVFARKHYFYPDLSKGYQTTQHLEALCQGGYIQIETQNFQKKIAIHHTHLEEDAGKSLHDLSQTHTYIDYNRAGNPLIEVVTEPDISSAEEAFLFLTKLHKIVRYLKVSDGNMEQGSLRCDANVSIRKKEDSQLGTRVEIKNINSMRYLRSAIEVEIKRMIELTEQGIPIVQETRGYNSKNNTTYSMRTKEDAHDYRYFTDPDLPPFYVEKEWIAEIKNQMPLSFDDLQTKIQDAYQFSFKEAQQLLDDIEIYELFEKLVSDFPHPKKVFNWIFGPIKTYLNKEKISVQDYPIKTEITLDILKQIESGKLNPSLASNEVLTYFLQNPQCKSVTDCLEKLGLNNQKDTSQIEEIVQKLILTYPDKVKEFKEKKKVGLLGFFVGLAMKELKGSADPKIVNELFLKQLQ